ncbi:hypothetical protein CHARACLAT_017123 [Characodon lateralis]|uniref:Uncharacterized protein n=1 Tax=Characodon lateralis TaxID=208331 RepID=A0ABU7EK20_9TELE|nr:hypothetical protein [Characodon lateralis]
MSFNCGRKPEYPVRTHTCTGRTCKLHAERPRPGIEPRTFLLQGKKCYQLRHRAALFIGFRCVFGNIRVVERRIQVKGATWRPDDVT